MNVYDFDKTIYKHDATVQFFYYCIFHYPRVLKIIPSVVSHWIKWKLNREDLNNFKNAFYAFMKYIPNQMDAVKDFWDKNIKDIKAWYFDKKKDDDLVISASPEFLIFEACSRLGIKAIASPVDLFGGGIKGENCRGYEKVKQFNILYPGQTVAEFYSDSHSDDPMATIASKAFLVKGNKLLPWDRN